MHSFIHFDFDFFCFLGLHLLHMEVSRLGVKLELQQLAYTTATATPDPSRICDYTAAHSNARSLTYWVRPGIEPAPSWILVRFVTTEAQRVCPPSLFPVRLQGSPPGPLTARPDTDLGNSQSLSHKWLLNALSPLINWHRMFVNQTLVQLLSSSQGPELGPSAWDNRQPFLSRSWPRGQLFSDLPSKHTTLSTSFPHTWFFLALLTPINFLLSLTFETLAHLMVCVFSLLQQSVSPFDPLESKPLLTESACVAFLDTMQTSLAGGDTWTSRLGALFEFEF